MSKERDSNIAQGVALPALSVGANAVESVIVRDFGITLGIKIRSSRLALFGLATRMKPVVSADDAH